MPRPRARLASLCLALAAPAVASAAPVLTFEKGAVVVSSTRLLI